MPTPTPQPAFLTRLRFKQIRLLSRILIKLSHLPGANPILALLGKSPTLANTLVGFRRTFPTFAAAQQHAATYHVPSHEHPGNVTTHLSLSEAARPSDYPVLAHLEKLLPEIATILDIGGSAGNLFYSYAQHLTFPPNFSWIVYEVPQNVLAGRRIAEQNDEPRLQFTDDLALCPRADAVIISGSLHYFESLPPGLLRRLTPPPRHIFINRTPVIDAPTVITIQDARTYYAISPARILSRTELLVSMSAAAYDLIDEWQVPDLKFSIPLHPQSSAPFYSGFYFRLRP